MNLFNKLLLVVLCLPTYVLANPITFQEHRMDLELGSQYFQTDSNYDPSPGSFVGLDGNNSFSNWRNTVNGQFSFTNRFMGFAELGYGLSDALTSEVQNSNSGMTHILGGFRYLLWHDIISIVPEISYSFSPETVDSATTLPLINNGTNDLTAKLLIGKITRKTTLIGYLGVQSRTEGLSTLIPWGVLLQLRMKQFLLEGEFRGYENLGDDSETSNSINRHFVANRVNGGSLYFYSVNPTVMEVIGKVGVRFTPKFSGLIGYGTTVNGSNMANGQTVIANLRYHFGQDVGSRREKYYESQRKLRTKQGLDEFEAETDESDLEFFEREDRKIYQGPKTDDQILKETEKILSR